MEDKENDWLSLVNSLITKIMHHILRFCYPYLKDIEREKELEAKQRLKSSFKHFGDCSTLGPDPSVCGVEHISIGDRFIARKGFRIETISHLNDKTPELIIGDNVTFEDWCHVGCAERITIGSGTMCASKVFITDHYHGDISRNDIDVPPGKRSIHSKPISIGRNVWIGDNVSIMPGVTLGDNIIVGANAVVTHSFPENVVIAGCPAKIIKRLE